MTMAGKHDRRRHAADVRSSFAVAAAVLALTALPGPRMVLAQEAAAGAAPGASPNTQQMIEALKPRTRGLRNLVVGEAAASAAAGEVAASAAPASVNGTPVSAASDAAAAMPAAPPSLSMAIRFDFDSAHLRPESAAVLDRLASALQTPELKDSRFRIEGHTDAKGDAAYNLRLSQQRADEVRRFLVAHGVSLPRLSAVGRGAQEPANPLLPLGAENRRVRIVNVEAE